MIADHPDLLRRFALAYQHGVADYRDAFLRLGPHGETVVDEKTDLAIPLLTRYVFTGDPDARSKILASVGYYNAGGALDVADVIEQIRWFKAQGLVKGDADPAALLDTTFLPRR
jgi:NitT/TauT family transport system substrate-binding protein